MTSTQLQSAPEHSPAPAASVPGAAANEAPAPVDPPDKSLLHYLGLAVSGAILLLVVALALLLIVVPKVTGSTPLTVLTSSMEPTLPPGTLIIVRPVTPDEIRIGDVVTYQIRSGEPGVITHRVTAISSSSEGGRTFTFKGDNNSVADADQVLPVQIQGRLWYSVPWVGWVNNAVNGQSRSWIVPIVAGLLFAYMGYMFASGAVSALRKRRRAAAAVAAGAARIASTPEPAAPGSPLR
ncbi:signal peptidase I [Cryobacterium sp. MDB1-18-2]|uniref:Signal peptidase I n=1 Tax=Cryobacterium glucosi TaxID=1259175 RepID=A0ABY2IMM8_9MICO|nr:MULTISPECIES: signal peptidase I [Cryobacterium]MEB0287429.1 signal peptidase I [Cryobacterium sp. 10S3]MEB0305501.1 signal peptidase I [Cryobacterium sp. 10I1]TFC20679.1 signal peptidase I [Cryobacterium glucosi]TFC36042.1 signal peptidase I [Cryobacterium sp. MDB1-18-2]TFC41663.1 signal peptidase I [Cryobacterium sp. MDB1-18-1]